MVNRRWLHGVLAVGLALLAAVVSVVAPSALARGLTARPRASRTWTAWLCRPGQRPDPCTPGLSTTVYSPRLARLRTLHPDAQRNPAIDCFYVYPTVSDQKTGNANLEVDPEERSIALYQAARYSQYCRVFAPMYRQVTLAGIGQGSTSVEGNPTLAYDDVARAFYTYLGRYSRGRGFVLIGHSQGSFILRRLIAQYIDPRPALRRRLVSAILLGGNVLVKPGRGVGGDFQHIPACRSATQLHCVIAFSTFDQTPPATSIFGRPTTSALGGKPAPGLQVLCTNPASLAGGSGRLDPIFPTAPFAPGTLLGVGIKAVGLVAPHPPTVWFSQPGSYSARCTSAGGAHVLQISPRGGARRPNPVPNADWGLHLLDANIALGNLVAIVHAEERAFSR